MEFEGEENWVAYFAANIPGRKIVAQTFKAGVNLDFFDAVFVGLTFIEICGEHFDGKILAH